VDIDPVLMAHTAGRLLATADGLTRLAQGYDRVLDLPDERFGNSFGGRALAAEYAMCGQDFVATLARTAEAISDNADRLYQVAFAYQETDERGRIRNTGRGD
jgi:hypothetical protein